MAANETSINDSQAFGFNSVVNSGIFWIALAMVGMVAFYWTGLSSLLEAWSRPEYGHGYLIAPIAIYLFLTYMSEEKEQSSKPSPQRSFGMAIVALGLLLGLIGNLSNIPDIITYGFISCIFGLVFVAMGAKRGLRYWAPLLYLIFMLPLPNFLYWPLSIKLQMISSEIGVAFIQLFNVPVFLGGNVIDLGEYKLQVAEACNGLRYLFPLASFGYLFAVLYKGPSWHKIILVLSTLPITVLMNSFRIGVIGLLVNSYGIEQADGFLHSFEGWVIFVACISMLYFEAVLLQKLSKNTKSVHEMLELDYSSLGRQFAKINHIQASRALKFTTVALLLAGLSWHLAPARASVTPIRDPLVLFPLQMDGWKGSRDGLDATITRVLGADDYLLANYTNKELGASTNLFIAYYKSQTDGSGIHSPEVCIPAGGWEVSKWTVYDTGLEMAAGKTLNVNRAIIQRGLHRQLVYYWFAQRGRHLTSDYAAKGYTVLDSITRGRTDGALIRVVTHLNPNEKMDVAEKRLKSFLKAAISELPKYVAN